MSTLVSVGQMVVLTNLKSRQDAICRVQKVRVFSNMPGYVEVEFTHPQPGYWGVRFPSEGSPVANKQATPAPVASAPPEPAHVAEKPIPEVSWAPAPPPAVTAVKPLDAQTSATEARPVVPPPPAFTPPTRPESSFISIGSQEKIQAVASNTPATGTTPHADQGMEPSPRESAKHTAPIDVPLAQPTAPLPSLSMQELRGDEERARTSPSSEIPFADLKQDLGGVSVEVNQSTTTTHATFGTLSGGASLGLAPMASEADFGTRLGAGLAVSAKDSEKPGRNWLLVAACILGFVGVAGGAAYYYTRSSAGPRKPSPVQSVAANPTGASYSTTQPALNPPVTPQPVPMSGITVTERSAPVANTNRTDVATTKTGTSAKQSASRLTPNVVTATLNAHPISSQRASTEDSNSAPSFDAGSVPASAQAAMPGVISSNSSMLPKPEDAVRVGGDVKPGRLISSVQPLYPPTAKMSHIEGDVVIKTNIDEVGRPVNMHVISGPMALRQAALDALRQWKYAPATLNGQPISTQLEVTIRFRL